MGTLDILAVCSVPWLVVFVVAGALAFRELRIREKAHREALEKVVAEKNALLSDSEGRIEQLQIDLQQAKVDLELAERRLKKAERESLTDRRKARNWAEVRRINDHENQRQMALEEEKRGNTSLRAG